MNDGAGGPACTAASVTGARESGRGGGVMTRDLGEEGDPNGERSIKACFPVGFTTRNKAVLIAPRGKVTVQRGVGGLKMEQKRLDAA